MAKYVLVISALVVIASATLKILTDNALFSFGIFLGAVVFIIALVYFINSLSRAKDSS